MSEKDEDDKLFHAWLQNNAMERMHRYVKAGRSFSTLDDADLLNHWVAQYKAYCANPHDLSARSASEDLAFEIDLRGLEPPYSAVEDDHEVMRKYMTHFFEYLKKHPEEYEKINNSLKSDIADFATEIEEEKNRSN